MAVGTIALADMIERVRALMRSYTSIQYSTTEITNALNDAQGKVFLSLNSEIKQNLYGDVADLAIATSEGKITCDLSTPDPWDILACKHIYVVDTTTYTEGMFKANIGFVLSVGDNDWRSGIHWARVGTKLYLSEDPNDGDDEVRIWYIKRPTDMGTLDVPNEYARLVALFAAADLIILAKDAPRDAAMQLRQEILYETRSLGLYPDRQGSMQSEADDPDPEDGGSHGERPVQG